MNAAGTSVFVRIPATPLCLCALCLLLLAFGPVARGAAPAKGPPAARVAGPGGPAWSQLTPDQKEALAPLQADWDQYDLARKKKWLDIAVRYKDLSPEGQQRMHERMPDLARLTPEQRKTARDNFTRAYALPPEKRRELTQQFQDLPEEKKRELAEQAKKKPAPAPRRAGSGRPAPKAAPTTDAAQRAAAPAGTAGAADASR